MQPRPLNLRIPFTLSLLAVAAGHAVAQQAPGQVQEVVVTATRVATPAQRTPVALTVYGGESLAEQGIATIEALQSIDTSVNLTKANGSGYVAIRGVASTDFTEAGDPSVAVARDGFFTNRSFSLGAGFYDLDRIEVLKGPQGTLFGRNSTGGLINIISARPTKKKEGYVQLGLGNYNALNFEGAFNLPLSDNAQLRVSGLARKHDGYRKMGQFDGSTLRGDDEDTKSVRVQLAVQPLPGLSALLALQADRLGGVGDVNRADPYAVVTPIGDSKRWTKWVPDSQRVDSDRLRWEVNYDRLPGNWSVVYQGGIDRTEWAHRIDATDLVHYPALRQFLQGEKPVTTNHEVRFVSPQSGPLTAQFGYYAFHEKNTTDTGMLNLAMVNPPPGATDYSNQFGLKFNYKLDIHASGVFGQLGWKLRDDVKLTLGVRHSTDDKARNGQSVVTVGALVSPFIPAVVKNTVLEAATSEGSKNTVLLGADWTITPDNFVYAKYATGYKSGGFNTNGTGRSVNYGPETVDSVEIGSKNRFFNRQLQLNVIAFTQNYKGYQAMQSTALLDNATQGVFNVGDAKIQGLELDFQANLANVARFFGAATLLHTRFGNGTIVRDASTNSNVDLGGNRLPNAPKLVVTGGVERGFGAFNGNVVARASLKHSTGFYYSVFNTPDATSPSYTTANLQATYSPAEGDWQATFFVDNVTDEVVLARRSREAQGPTNLVQFQAPRTFGVRLRYNF